ncbi:MAG TPA: hypothetical protein VK488_14345 [Gaiellaceae bacterium]|nr:hypothetical protein [Gaiellaceae bacterium]
MKSKQEHKVKEEMGPFLEEGEEVRAVLIARPRGWTQSMAGGRTLGVGQAIGGRAQKQARTGAEEAGIKLASPGAIVLTQKRLLTVQTGEALVMGKGGSVKEVLSAIPVSDVDSIKVKRLLLGYVVTLKVRGSEFKLEANAAAGAKPMAEALERAKIEA